GWYDGAMVLVTFAETKVTRRRGARAPIKINSCVAAQEIDLIQILSCAAVWQSYVSTSFLCINKQLIRVGLNSSLLRFY
ncbi:MAG: hypothetical protein OQK68_07990, partial [Sedimenticola sp.]|nr:hypothetical protein [Sedimenticola sp.]